MAFPIKLSQFSNFHRELSVEIVTLRKERPKLFPSSFQSKFERMTYFKVIASASENFTINVVEQDITNKGLNRAIESSIHCRKHFISQFYPLPVR